jgi:thiol-disulfide isomerase/thioredoxin
MQKALIFFSIAAVCVVVAFHYLPPDFFSSADAANNGNAGAIADMDQALPQAVLPSLNNDWVDLSTYKGQVVFMVFWTTWCPGCIDEVPTLIHLQQVFSAKGFTVLAIAVDDQGEESVQSFVENKRFSVNGASASINYPVLLSRDETARTLGFEGGLPAGVLVDRNGREVKIIRGVVSEAALSKAIQRLVRN